MPFRPHRSRNATSTQVRRPVHRRPPGIRPPGNARRAVGDARSNYERYITMAKDAAGCGDVVEAENFFQHAEHYFRIMRERE
jgi:hypothetical protein